MVEARRQVGLAGKTNKRQGGTPRKSRNIPLRDDHTWPEKTCGWHQPAPSASQDELSVRKKPLNAVSQKVSVPMCVRKARGWRRVVHSYHSRAAISPCMRAYAAPLTAMEVVRTMSQNRLVEGSKYQHEHSTAQPGSTTLIDCQTIAMNLAFAAPCTMTCPQSVRVQDCRGRP